MRKLLFSLVFVLLLFPQAELHAQPEDDTDDPCHVPAGIEKVRPDEDKGPTPITIGVYVLDVMAINDMDQTFLADFFVRLKWMDPRLARPAADGVETCNIPITSIWRPLFLIINQRDVAIQMRENVYVSADGTARMVARVYGSLASPNDLSDFPRDEQLLNITVLLRDRFGNQEIRLDESLMGQEEAFSLRNWHIDPGTSHIESMSVSQLEGSFPIFTYAMKVKRNLGFYFWKIIFPMTLIVFMSWTVFWISPEHRVAQISLSGAAMLTMIAFQLVLVNLLPQVAYLTAMDKYILTCTVLVFVSLVESVTSSVLAGRGKEDLAVRVDYWSRRVCPMLFVLSIIVSFWV